MTALTDFERLECQGIWRPTPDSQRRDVIVSVGKATLTISDQQGLAIAHWSLPAVERVNGGERPAIFRPGADANETLELTDETMILAIAKVQSAVNRQRPHPGRLRFGLVGGSIALTAALALFWLPNAMISYTASVVPSAKRIAIGDVLLANIKRVAGKPCDSVLGTQSLSRLQARLFGDTPGKIVVLSDGVLPASHLPGQIILLNRELVEDHEQVEVAAGYAIVENLRASQHDPLVQLLDQAGLMAAFRLLTTGDIPETVLSSYSEHLLIAEPETVPEKAIVEWFQNAEIRSSPYAYAIDISGETTLALIESDAAAAHSAKPILADGDWVSLQGICGE